MGFSRYFSIFTIPFIYSLINAAKEMIISLHPDKAISEIYYLILLFCQYVTKKSICLGEAIIASLCVTGLLRT